jgi:hypothetical protein
MRSENKLVATNFVIVLLALEVRNFFEKGGANNELAYCFIKIILLTLFVMLILNVEDVTRIFIQRLDGANGETMIGMAELAGRMTVSKLIPYSIKK